MMSEVVFGDTSIAFVIESGVDYRVLFIGYDMKQALVLMANVLVVTTFDTYY